MKRQHCDWKSVAGDENNRKGLQYSWECAFCAVNVQLEQAKWKRSLMDSAEAENMVQEAGEGLVEQD